MLGGFITPAGCTKLELESSISYALAVTGFLLCTCSISSAMTIIIIITVPINSVVSREPEVIHTSSNEAYHVVRQTGRPDTSHGYETVTTHTTSVHPPNPHPTQLAGDSLYEPV